MMCLSIRQPWAWAIIHAGKDIENRSWATSYRGPLLIHASKSVTKGAYEGFLEFVKDIPGVETPDLASLLRGGIIGSVYLADCVRGSNSPWFVGSVGFVLENPAPLPWRPMRGRLSLFEVAA
jgi:hypothetical protein